MRTLKTLFCSLCLVASTVWANAPNLVTYQGNLANSGGSPLTGTYNMTFSVYATPTGGSALWAETLSTVSVTSGLFSVVLGSVHSVGSAVFVASERWLGVKVNPDPELTPRMRMASTPYSLTTGSIDSAAGGYVFGATRIFRNAGGSVLLGYNVDPLAVELRNAAGVLVGNLSYFDGAGSNLELRDATGQTRVIAASDVPDTPYLELLSSLGPTVRLRAEAGDSRLQMFDNTSSDSLSLRVDQTTDSAGPELRMVDNTGDAVAGWLEMGLNQAHSYLQMIDSSGPGNSIEFNTELSGDASAKLPSGAINAQEMSNEPGLAQNFNAVDVILSQVAMIDLVVVTVTVPSAGYIRLEGNTTLRLSGTAGNNWANVQIDETAGGSVGANYAQAGASKFADTVLSFIPVSVSRVYFVPAGGSYTYRLEANMATGPTSQGRAQRSTLTALFYPTSYGTVVTVASQSGVQQLGTAALISPEPGAEPNYLVDLRELELKAAKADAEAERTSRQLLEAQLRAQPQRAEKVASPGSGKE